MNILGEITPSGLEGGQKHCQEPKVSYAIVRSTLLDVNGVNVCGYTQTLRKWLGLSSMQGRTDGRRQWPEGRASERLVSPTPPPELARI